MLVYHHDPECHAKISGTYLQGQGQGDSAGWNPWKRTLFHISWTFATKHNIVVRASSRTRVFYGNCFVAAVHKVKVEISRECFPHQSQPIFLFFSPHRFWCLHQSHRHQWNFYQFCLCNVPKRNYFKFGTLSCIILKLQSRFLCQPGLHRVESSRSVESNNNN